MLLYRDNELPLVAKDNIRIISYNIDHGDDFNNESNNILRETLKSLLYNENNNSIPKFIFLQECTQDILEFLSELLLDDSNFNMIYSKKIINDKTRKYNNFEYFIIIYNNFAGNIELRHNELIDINSTDLLTELEKNVLIDTPIGKNKSISLYRKLLDSNKLLVQHVQFKLENNEFINFYNVHLSSKPYLNFIQAYMLKKYLSIHDLHGKELVVILGDFNNKFNSYSLHLLKQNIDINEFNHLDLKLKNKSSKLRNINKVTNTDYLYENVTDKLLLNRDKLGEVINKTIDHILYDKSNMKLISYTNDMHIEYKHDNTPSDHFYVDCLFKLSNIRT